MVMLVLTVSWTHAFSYIFMWRYAYTKLLLKYCTPRRHSVVVCDNTLRIAHISTSTVNIIKYSANVYFSFPYPSLSNALKHASMSKFFSVLYWSNQSFPPITSQLPPSSSTIFACLQRPQMREHTAYSVTWNHLTNTSVQPILKK